MTNREMAKIVIITLLIALIIFFILYLLFFKPWSEKLDCLEKIARDFCSERDMEYKATYYSMKEGYSFECLINRKAVSYEFKPRELEVCSDKK